MEPGLTDIELPTKQVELKLTDYRSWKARSKPDDPVASQKQACEQARLARLDAVKAEERVKTTRRSVSGSVAVIIAFAVMVGAKFRATSLRPGDGGVLVARREVITVTANPTKGYGGSMKEDETTAKGHAMIKAAADRLDSLLELLTRHTNLEASVHAAPDPAAARRQIRDQFGVADDVAKAFLDMPVRRLATSERDRVKEPRQSLSGRS